ncbi:leucyl aminopeptidase [Candidatus Woesearchaeota archaeon]|nr:leucyl aminopeptidase [Candidatus Woesearchaeota archaeon]
MASQAKKDAKITCSSLNIKAVSCNSLIIGFFQGKLSLNGRIKEINSSFDSLISACLRNADFKGEYGETKSLFANKNNLRYIILVGLGEEEKYTLEKFNFLIAELSKRARDSNADKLGILLESFSNGKISEEQIAENAAISSRLGLHQLVEFRTKELDKLKSLSEVCLISGKNHGKIVEKAQVISDAVIGARDLANTPPNVANPEYVANYAREISKKSGLKCTILNKSDIEKLKMGCFLAVAQGSRNEPRLVVLEYNGAGKGEKPVVLVGKGITFDSGGLNIKPYPSMCTMKGDKTGAVTAIHVIEACALLKLPVNVVSITPLCENMPDAGSYRPDDILKAYNGMTVEVKNTDAEGRMVLADALSYANKYNPKAIIDIATLTGATMVILGTAGTPIMGNDDKLLSRIREASKSSLDKVWELPLWDEYAELLKSEIADIKHLNEEGGAGTIIGGIFLKNFVGNTPWAHLDIASTSWAKADAGIMSKGSTGVPVRLLIELLSNWK